MTPENQLMQFPTYASEAFGEDAFIYNSDPSASSDPFMVKYATASDNYARGFNPLETFPAIWYNSIMQRLTMQAQFTKNLLDSIFVELSNVITAGGASLDKTSTTQLLDAIDKITELQVASVTVLGGVKASTDSWGVSVDTDGEMSVNTVDASTSIKGLVQLNDTNTSTSKTEAATANAVKTAYDTATNMDLNSVTAAVVTNTLTVKVKNSKGTEKSDTANVVTAASLSKSGNNLNVSVNGVSGTAVNPINTVLMTSELNKLGVSVNGVAATKEMVVSSVGLSLSGTTLTVSVNGVTASQDLSSLQGKVERATYARYLVPTDTSTDTSIYASSDGKLNAGSLTLN